MRRRIVSLALLLFVPSCTFYKLASTTKLKPPEFAIVGCEIKSISSNHANLDLFVSAYNPNPVGLKNVYLNYELSTQGRRLMKGRDVRIELDPLSETTLVVPSEIEFSDIINAMGPLLDRILSRQMTIPITVNAIFHGRPTLYNEHEQGSLFSFEKRVSKTVEVSLSRDDMEKGKRQLRQELKKLF